MNMSQRIVDGPIGLALEHNTSMCEFDQFETELLAHRRLQAAREHRLQLLQTIRGQFGVISQGDHQVSWKGRTSAKNNHAGAVKLTATTCQAWIPRSIWKPNLLENFERRLVAESAKSRSSLLT
jgi:hypothetical protein